MLWHSRSIAERVVGLCLHGPNQHRGKETLQTWHPMDKVQTNPNHRRLFLDTRRRRFPDPVASLNRRQDRLPDQRHRKVTWVRCHLARKCQPRLKAKPQSGNSLRSQRRIKGNGVVSKGNLQAKFLAKLRAKLRASRPVSNHQLQVSGDNNPRRRFRGSGKTPTHSKQPQVSGDNSRGNPSPVNLRVVSGIKGLRPKVSSKRGRSKVSPLPHTAIPWRKWRAEFRSPRPALYSA